MTSSLRHQTVTLDDGIDDVTMTSLFNSDVIDDVKMTSLRYDDVIYDAIGIH